MVTPLRPPVRPLHDPGPGFVWIWEPSDLMVRIYHDHPHRPPVRARTFGPLNRFDPHVRDRRQRARQQVDGRGVNYVAVDLAC
ncbi:MAG TPA: hypothetical protein VI094_24485, partial [Propionibacteriaceae bacterium]